MTHRRRRSALVTAIPVEAPVARRIPVMPLDEEMIMLALILLLCLGFAPASAQSWTPIPLGTSADIYAIENTYLPWHWVCGAEGFAARSNNDRTQWTTQDPQTQEALYSIQEPGGNEAWLGAGHGVVRLNVYGMWFERDIPSPNDFRLFTRTGATAVAVGTSGLIFQTTDAGNTWTQRESGTTSNLNAGAGMPTGSSWIVGDGGIILKSADGVLWQRVASGTTANLYAIAELDLTNLYVVGAAGTILKSTDAGATWHSMPSGTGATLRAVSISKQNADHLLAVGLGGTVLRSTDSGAMWCPLNVTTADLYAAEAFSDTEMYVGGAGGLLMRTTDGGGPCGTPAEAGDEFVDPLRIALTGPYPQPVRDFAILLLPAGAEQIVRTEIFDSVGRLVVAVPDRPSASPLGERSIRIDTRGLVPGVYLVRVSSASARAARRIVVAR